MTTKTPIEHVTYLPRHAVTLLNQSLGLDRNLFKLIATRFSASYLIMSDTTAEIEREEVRHNERFTAPEATIGSENSF